ncbi:MAG: DUF3488 and transglutaminase-like domain-containing protein [Desulfurivibrionaceae bacterium]
MIPLRPGRLWLLGSLTAVLLPPLLRLPPWFTAYCFALLGWRSAIDLRGWPLPRRRLHLPLTLAGIGAVLLGYRTLFGPDAGLALLSVMLCLKLLELRSLRDAMLIIFLGWFLVAGVFLVVEPSILLGGYLLLTVLLLTAALIALNHPVTQTGPPRFYLQLAATLLLQALPIMFFLFLLFPRLPGPLWHVPQNPNLGRTGMADHMSPGSIARLADSEEVAFRVQFEGKIPPASQLYWRGPVLWTTDGHRWDRLRGAATPWFSQPASHEALGQEVRYALTLEPNSERWLFALELPATVPHGFDLTADFQLLQRRKLNARQRFELAAHTRYRTPPLSEEERRLSLQLPEGRNPRSHALARQWSTLAPAQIVQTALALFREQPYWYTRQPPLLGSEAMDEFLFDSRRGFCEHYAAAFVTLMRGAGVPARVVTGYQGGEHNPLADYLIVRQSHAHAWAEVWLAQEGWQRVDPTAVLPPTRVEAESDQQRFRSTNPLLLDRGQSWLTRNLARLRYGWDALDNGWNLWVLGYNNLRQEELLGRLGLLRFGWQGVVAVMLATTATTLGVVLLRLLLQGRSQSEPVLRLYARYCRKLARIGLSRAPHEGPAAFARRAAQARPDLALKIAEISELYIGLRYGHADNESTLPRLRAAVQRFQPPTNAR